MLRERHPRRTGNMFLQMKTLIVLISIGSTLSAVFPVQDAQTVYLARRLSSPELRLKRAAIPARAIMYSGYFGTPRGYHFNPPFNARNYEPQGAMTAFAAGDSVATRSYYGNEYQPSNIQPNCGTCLPNGQEIPQGQPDSTGVTLPPVDDVTQPEPPVTIFIDPVPPQGPADAPEQNPDLVPIPPNDIPASPEIPDVPQVQETPEAPETDVGKDTKNGNGQANGNGNGYPNVNGNGGRKNAKTPKVPPKKPDDDEEEYDEEEEQPFLPGKGRGPGKHYNSYFPIYFGLPGYGSRGQGEGGPLNPGVATAIANSYSNGKGAVATSHATAYGGPNFGNGSKKGSKGRAPQ